MKKKSSNVSTVHAYLCNGPFTYGTGVCVHGWNSGHTLSEDEASRTDQLTNCGLLPARQKIDRYEPEGVILYDRTAAGGAEPDEEKIDRDVQRVLGAAK